MSHRLTRHLCKPAAGQKFALGATEYVLHGKLGDGAASLVRKAQRSHDNARFAIKFLAPDPKYIDEAVFDDVAARFRREGQRSQQLRYDGLVTVHAYDENYEGRAFAGRGPKNPFILMEEVSGRTLENYIRKEEQRRFEKQIPRNFALTPDRLAIAVNVASALSYLHQKKLIHRDVKPANIFLPEVPWGDRPKAKLGDFGIMKWGDFQASVSTGTLTVTSQQGLGTLKYMSPEQALEPREVTVRSDMFSLGITLWELFTGQILASPHHVFQIREARVSRGTTASRLIELGYRVDQADLPVAELILDMFLRSPRGRPQIERVAGRLQSEWERRTDSEW